MEECNRNQEISELLSIWEWCSKTLHAKWQRKRRNRNSCLMALAYAISEPDFISPFKLTKIYKSLPRPLLPREKVLTLWTVQPVSLLELCLGCFTKNSSLRSGLDRIRMDHQNNVVLNKLAKKMRAREKRFGDGWYFEGHHPEEDFSSLKDAMAPLQAKLRQFVARSHRAIDGLAAEVLAQGGWQFGELPATSFVRRTPESLLNRSTRLKLWLAAHDVVSRELEEDERIEMICSVLAQKITPSLKASIEARGYTVDQVIDDMLNFDMYKSRGEITG
jgi:hypothetical protein